MRHLVVPAVLAATLVVLLETAAVALAWSAPAWVLAAAIAVAGVTAFLIAGRLRALRLRARRRARRPVTGHAAAPRPGAVRVIAPKTTTAAATGDRGGRPDG
jgi:hypothetical protein